MPEMDAISRPTTAAQETTTAKSRFVTVNGLQLHYLDHAGVKGPLVFLHGLSANAHSFDELIESGVAPRFRALALDLRGRGRSDKPESGYTLDDHARDVVDWLDALGLQEVLLVGHSYGAFLAAFIAWRHPTRIVKLVLLDIAASAARDPRVAEMLKPSLGRLDHSWTSELAYITEMKAAPFLSAWWNPALERYFQTDIEMAGDGQIRSVTRREAVAAAAYDAACQDWPAILSQLSQPVLLFHAAEGFGSEGAMPLVLREDAEATARLVPNCRCVPATGNHITMLFGGATAAMATAIADFSEAGGAA